MSGITSTLIDTILAVVAKRSTSSAGNVPPRTGKDRQGDVARQVSDDSYDSLTRETRVDPFCLLDTSLLNQSYTDDLLSTSLDILVAYYMQAVSILNVGKGVSPVTLLRKLNNDPGNLASESLKPTDYPDNYVFGLTTESRTSRGGGRTYDPNGPRPVPVNQGKHAGVPTEVSRSNQVVGKMLKIPFDTGEGIAEVLVNFYLDIINVPPPAMVNYMQLGKPSLSFSNRLRALRAGKIRLWRDFILAGDLVEDHKKLMLMDRNNIIKTIIERRAAGLKRAAEGGGRSYGVSSNCILVSTDTLDQVEASLGGPIEDEHVRATLFNELSLLVMAVVDKEFKRITFYYRNKPHGQTVSASALKSANSKGGINLEDFAKALASPKTPTF